MNARTAELYLQCRRPAGGNSSAVEKALRFAANDSEMTRRLREREEFDRQVGDVVHALQPPDDLKRRLAAIAAKATESAKKKRPQFTIPLLIAMVCGVLSIIGLLVVLEMDHLARFPGREIAERLIQSANSMSGIELEPVSKPTGQLGDWFYMHGFENYAAPSELTKAPAVGLRVFTMDGKPVAQVAVDQHNSLLYIFRASDFREDIPKKSSWTTFEHDGWAGAMRRKDDICMLLIFRGDSEEMEKFLQKPKS